MARTPKPWQRKSTGCWFVQIDGKKVYLGKDEKVARKKYHRLMVRGKAPTTVTVRQIVKDYWDWAKANLAATTCERRQPVLESFAQFISAALKAEDLRAHHVQKWVDANGKVKVYKKQNGEKKAVVTDKKISSTTAGDRITLIKGVMSWAKRMGYIDSNPIADMSKPTPQIPRWFLPAERWQELLSHALDPNFRDLLEFMLLTGVRAEELFRLRRSHFEQDDKGSRLRLPVHESKGRFRERVIQLPQRALEIIQAQWSISERKNGDIVYRLGDGDTVFRDRYLFTNSKGQPWTKSSIKGRFKRLKRLMKEPRLNARSLRRSFGQYRLTSGQDGVTVSTLMGHVDTRMLATRYSDLNANPEFMAAAANAVPFPGEQTAAANRELVSVLSNGEHAKVNLRTATEAELLLLAEQCRAAAKTLRAPIPTQTPDVANPTV